MKIILTLAIAAAAILTPAIAYADPPADWDEGMYAEHTEVVDPVACTITVTDTQWSRENTLDPDTYEITGWGPWTSEVVNLEVAGATEDLCPDWHIDEDGDWYYTPPPVVIEGDDPGAPVGVISEIMHVGVAKGIRS
jgi:hypothetical protein